MVILAILALIFILVVLFLSKSAVDNNEEPNALLVVIAEVLAITFAIFFAAAAIYMYLYKPFHYGDIVLTHANDEKKWKKHYGDKTFDKAWK